MFRTVPQALSDAYLTWGNDLVLSATGDLQLVTGVVLSQQRVIRRLMTAVGSYVWQANYGAGLPAYVGQALSTASYTQVRSIVRSQIALETSVAQTPAPQILFQNIQNGLLSQINYVVSPLQQPTVLSFNVTPTGLPL